METLKLKSDVLINNQNVSFQRSLFSKIDWRNRLIGIMGARGTGKTTILLQQIKTVFGTSEEAIYISLDDMYFSNRTLTETVEAFRLQGGKYLFLDEVHKYPDWSREIKNCYDFYRELFIVFTGSSIVDMLQLPVDLSRRALIYDLSGLSFREYIELDQGIAFPTIGLTDLLTGHRELAHDIASRIKPVRLFQDYLSYGYYPFYKENIPSYHLRLEKVVRLIIEFDLSFLERIDYQNIRKVLQLLNILAEHVPFTPNIAELSDKLGMGRNTLVQYLHYLERARLINTLYASGKGFGKLEKPGKILLENTNLFKALSQLRQDKGSLREVFFVSQLKNAGYTVALPSKGDFIVNDRHVFEVGGRQKGYAQIAGLPDSYVAADNIETGTGNKIPLWVFGFLS